MIAQLLAAMLQFQNPWPQMPPARFDHAYGGKLTVLYGDQQTVHRICSNNFAAACAFPNGKSCTIVLPKPTLAGSPEVYAALRRHEIAHCNGWPANHPQ